MKRLIFVIPLGFLLLFFYIPVLTILKESFYVEGNLSLDNFSELLASPYHLHVIRFTFRQAFISLFFTLLIGLPAAYIFSHYSFPGKSIIRPLFLIPFVLPSIIVALGFILLYGQNGYLNRFLAQFNINLRILYRLEAIILAHSFYNFPIVLKFVSDAWQRVNRQYTFAAQTLGAGRLRTFFRITLPSLLPSIINSSVLVFIYCFMSFGIVLVLGSVRYTTLEVNIYVLVYHLIRFPLGMSLGTIQLVFSLFFLYLAIKSNRYYINNLNLLSTLSNEKDQTQLFSMSFLRKVLRRLSGKPFPVTEADITNENGSSNLNTRSKRIQRLLCFIYLLFLLFIMTGPLLAIVVFGLLSNLWGNISLSNIYHSVFTYNRLLGTTVASALVNSLILAFSAALLTVIISLVLTRSIVLLEQNPVTRKFAGVLEFMTIIPLVVSGVTFSLGYLRFIYWGYFDFNRLFLIIIAHTVIALPFASRVIIQAVRNIPSNHIRAAMSLGANPISTLLGIVLPQIRKSILLAFSFAFAISLGEIGAVMMLGGGYVTIPLAIYRFIGARQLVSAVNMGIVLLLVTFLFFFLIEKLSNGSEG